VRVLRAHRAPVLGCGVSADGRRVVSASVNRTMPLWSAADTAAPAAALTGHTADVEGCALSDDGQFAASAGKDGAGYLYDLAALDACPPRREPASGGDERSDAEAETASQASTKAKVLAAARLCVMSPPEASPVGGLPATPPPPPPHVTEEAPPPPPKARHKRARASCLAAAHAPKPLAKPAPPAASAATDACPQRAPTLLRRGALAAAANAMYHTACARLGLDPSAGILHAAACDAIGELLGPAALAGLDEDAVAEALVLHDGSLDFRVRAAAFEAAAAEAADAARHTACETRRAAFVSRAGGDDEFVTVPQARGLVVAEVVGAGGRIEAQAVAAALRERACDGRVGLAAFLEVADAIVAGYHAGHHLLRPQ
jgi:hypothetical protein